VFLSLIAALCHAQGVAPVSDVKITVSDESGAVIPDCKVVLKNHSETVVSHTGIDGTVTVTLRGGQYALTTAKPGFVNANAQIVAPMKDTLRIVMKVERATFDGDPVPGTEVPIATSDLPNAIEDKPSRVLFSRPATKYRSWRCLYLWKCSAS
jgi:hypothetical protein